MVTRSGVRRPGVNAAPAQRFSAPPTHKRPVLAGRKLPLAGMGRQQEAQLLMRQTPVLDHQLENELNNTTLFSFGDFPETKRQNENSPAGGSPSSWHFTAVAENRHKTETSQMDLKFLFRKPVPVWVLTARL